MNKDNELKKDPHYSSLPLRRRIQRSVKQVRDFGDETDRTNAKILPIIPVTGKGDRNKYFNNKSPKEY